MKQISQISWDTHNHFSECMQIIQWNSCWWYYIWRRWARSRCRSSQIRRRLYSQAFESACCDTPTMPLEIGKFQLTNWSLLFFSCHLSSHWIGALFVNETFQFNFGYINFPAIFSLFFLGTIIKFPSSPIPILCLPCHHSEHHTQQWHSPIRHISSHCDASSMFIFAVMQNALCRLSMAHRKKKLLLLWSQKEKKNLFTSTRLDDNVKTYKLCQQSQVVKISSYATSGTR